MTTRAQSAAAFRLRSAVLLVLVAALPAQAQQNDAVAFAAWVGLARVKADANDRAASVAAWREAERLQPLSTGLLKELFWVLAEHRPADARDLARQLLTADPQAAAVREKAIYLASAAGDDRDVEALATAAIDQEPSARWTRPLALTAMRRGEHARAVEWWRRTVDAQDRSAGDAALLAIALSAAGDDRAAAVAWDAVAPELWRGNTEWTRNRLLSRVKAAWSPDVRHEADAWLLEHPDDDVMRQVVVAALQRRGEHAAALEVSAEAADTAEWARVRARLADEARRPEIARQIRRQLARRSDATTTDRLSAAEWFRSAGDEGEALTIARGLVGGAGRCADELVSLLYRLQSPEALSELSQVLRKYPRSCPAYESWTQGVVDKLMTVQRFGEASEFAEPLALLTDDPANYEIAGQLRLWNGDAAGAVALLLPLVERPGVSAAALDAAIDALRAVERPADAWRLAERRLVDQTLDPARALTLAELALDNGVAAAPQRIARRVAADRPALKWQAENVLGQALLLAGTSGAAFDTLDGIPVESLDDRGRRALVQAQADVARERLEAHAPVEAIDVLTRRAGMALPAGSRALLARAYVQAGRTSEANREYVFLTAGDDATAETFVEWSRIRRDGADRLAVLDAGHDRFPGDTALTLELAIAQQRAGDLERAVILARAVLAANESEAAAWRILIDHVRREPAAADTARLARVPVIYAHDAAIVIELAERLGAAGGSDAGAAAALRWLGSIETPSAPLRTARELARARLLNSRGHAAAALDIVQTIVADGDPPLDARRLHAQLLGWNGHHTDSLAAYDTYLRLAPDDIEARREQARVAGWAQQFQRARRLYEAIHQRVPADSAARAEGEAKRFFYAARWRDAERAYAHWLTVEPLSEEAAFEYAETLVAQGRLQEARDVYDQLTRRQRPHEMADAARRALEERADPSGGLSGTFVSSKGYEGQRLLEWSEARGRVVMPVFRDRRQTVELSGSSLTFTNGAFRLPAYSGGASASLAHAWGGIDGSFSLARGDRNMASWQGHAAADLLLRHNLALRVGVERTTLLENLTAVRDGLAVWGPMLSLDFSSPDTELTLSARRAAGIASNLQTTGGLTARQRVHRGSDEVRVVAGANYTGWRKSDLRFFSPGAFTRADGGIEWTRWLRVPKFRFDRKSSLTVRYLAGVDSRGELYHQPFARLALEHRRVAIDTSASWITSPVYRSLTLQLGVRIGG